MAMGLCCAGGVSVESTSPIKGGGAGRVAELAIQSWPRHSVAEGHALAVGHSHSCSGILANTVRRDWVTQAVAGECVESSDDAGKKSGWKCHQEFVFHYSAVSTFGETGDRQARFACGEGAPPRVRT